MLTKNGRTNVDNLTIEVTDDDDTGHRIYRVFLPDLPYQHYIFRRWDALIKFVDNRAQRANAQLIEAAPDLLQAAQCALADLEGLRSEGIFYEDEGKPPQVETIEELQKAIKRATT